EFGVVRFTLAAALVATMLTSVLSTSAGREIGRARGDRAGVGPALGSAAAAAAALLALTVVVLVGLHAAGVLGDTPLVGLLVAVVGVAALELYYAVSGGLGRVRRLVASYAGASVLQLLALVALVLVADPGATTVLVLFGASNVVACAAIELARPIWPRRQLGLSAGSLRRLRDVAVPLAAGHIGFTVWSWSDLMWVESTFGGEDTGFYGAAKTLSMLFIVVPAAIRAILMPRLAYLRAKEDDRAARALGLRIAAGSAAVALVLALLVVAVRTPLVELLYGSDYAPATAPLLGLVVAMALFMPFASVVAVAVGWGRPSLGAACLVAAAAVELGLLLVAPADAGLTYGAWANAAAMGAGVACLAVALAARPLELRRPPAERGPGVSR
ncbi:MAG TPA: oligosaccharide flippase family protein, partial [Solirubrobacteraceae bacterium]|nr:oligosaccharide flippase family protein [Solirubrobacteraceae bacterium]